MASRVKPRPPYVPTPKPAKEKKPTLQRKKRMRMMALDTAKEKRANDQMSKAFLRYNPVCACGCGEDAASWHHIAAGSAGKEATRYDTDLALPAAEFCNSADVFHDPYVWPRDKQLACKIRMILDKYNQAAVKRVEPEAVIANLPLKWDRLAEILQERQQ